MRSTWYLMMALTACTAAGLSAQTEGVLHGRVMDAMTLNPVGGAFVAQVDAERGVLTDSTGLFMLQMSPAFGARIRIWQLGYRTLETDASGASEGRLLTVALSPDPVQIDGLTVLAERLAGRRRGPYGVGEILDREQLMSASEGSSYELVLRTMPFARPCSPQESEALCMSMRRSSGEDGRVKVCVDGSLIPPDYTETILGALDPRTLYLAEVYTRVGEVRLYTPGYVQRLLQLGEDLPPLTFTCQGPGMNLGPG